VALHPKWWATLGRIRKNSRIASVNLCSAVTHLIEQYPGSVLKQKAPLA
jgi:hypothetical protein